MLPEAMTVARNIWGFSVVEKLMECPPRLHADSVIFGGAVGDGDRVFGDEGLLVERSVSRGDDFALR